MHSNTVSTPWTKRYMLLRARFTCTNNCRRLLDRERKIARAHWRTGRRRAWTRGVGVGASHCMGNPPNYLRLHHVETMLYSYSRVRESLRVFVSIVYDCMQFMCFRDATLHSKHTLKSLAHACVSRHKPIHTAAR